MYCEICGKRPAVATHHLCFGNGRRPLADSDSLVIEVCNECHTTGDLSRRIHDNSCAEKLSKMLGQMMFERNKCAEGMSIDEARETFIKKYGRAYI